MRKVLNLLQWNIDLTREGDLSVITSRLEVLKTLVEEYSPNIVALQEADCQDVKDAFPSSQYDFHIDGGLVTAYKKRLLVRALD